MQPVRRSRPPGSRKCHGSPTGAGARKPPIAWAPNTVTASEDILHGVTDPPPFPPGNIFPIEWRVEAPKPLKLYESARRQSWVPAELPWDDLDPEAFTLDQRYAIAYWFGQLAVFDSSGPAVFARAMIRTYERHEEGPLRKCFFLITRDEVNHDEVRRRVIQRLTAGGPLGYEPETTLGKLAQNNVKWYFHNGTRYWEGYKKGIRKYPLRILFASFPMGEMASSNLFQTMHQRTTIPTLKEGFRRVGRDEARHLRICPTLDQRRENWRTAMLRLKGLVDPYGIAFPAIPEIGIDGEAVPFDPDDIIPVF